MVLHAYRSGARAQCVESTGSCVVPAPTPPAAGCGAGTCRQTPTNPARPQTSSEAAAEQQI